MDKILINDLRVNGIIGIYDFERDSPQEILINLVLFTQTKQAAETDDISKCVDYEKIANTVRTHAQSSLRLTVEALAEDIAAICLAIAGVSKVSVRVEKTQAIHFTASVGVEIERENL